MTTAEKSAYEEGFREALCEAFEWQEYAERLERRCERLQAALWGAAGIAAGLTLASVLLWIER